MLSIIIPVKNEEELIINSIEKIFDEVKNIDFEIIIIDDFSHDRTLELIDQISKKYKNIKGKVRNGRSTDTPIRRLFSDVCKFGVLADTRTESFVFWTLRLRFCGGVAE